MPSSRTGSETPGSRSIEITGDVALVRQEFTVNFTNSSATEAIDVFSCARVGSAWSIISVLGDMQPKSRPRRP